MLEVVSLPGEFDFSAAPKLSKSLQDALQRAEHVIADLTATHYMDSFALAALVRLKKRVGSRLQLVIPAEGNIAKLFARTNVRDALAVRSSVDEARRAIEVA